MAVGGILTDLLMYEMDGGVFATIGAAIGGMVKGLR